MDKERWKIIPEFPNYSVSTFGRIRAEKSERILKLKENNSGLVFVGLFRGGIQYQRSVPRLVARAFPRQENPLFDTPINLDGNRSQNGLHNLSWRPRWFALKYHKQFEIDFPQRIYDPIENVNTGEISENSLECAKRYGVLESDVFRSVFNYEHKKIDFMKFPVWPINQEFRAVY